MEDDSPITLKAALADIDRLFKIWKDVKPEAQMKLKLVIDNKISLLPNCREEHKKTSPYQLLENLTVLTKKLAEAGFETDAVDDVVMEEIETMIAKNSIGTPAMTEVSHIPNMHCFKHRADIGVARRTRTTVRTRS